METRCQSSSQHTEPPAPPVKVHPPLAAAGGDNADRKLLAEGGAVLTVASAVVGTVFTLKSNAASNDAHNALDEAAAASDPGTDPNALCNDVDRPSGCDVGIDRLNDREAFRNVAIGAFVATGVFAAATVTTYLLWPSSSRPASSSARA